MKRVYEIWAGQQYDKDGATVKHGRSGYARYDSQGKFDGGDPLALYDQAEIEAAVLRVISTRQDETVTLGEDEQPDPAPTEKMARLRGRMARWERDDV